MAPAMPPAFRRGWEGEGKPQIDALARASGRQPATRGRLFAVSGTRGRSPWRSRLKYRMNEFGQRRSILYLVFGRKISFENFNDEPCGDHRAIGLKFVVL